MRIDYFCIKSKQMFKKIKTFLFAATIPLLIIACQSKHPEHKAAPVMETTTADGGIKIELASLALPDDPVCGMALSDGVADTLTYNGKLYGFCSPGCKEDFLKEPTKYLK
jgi:YHS domain-containing protein